MTTPNATEHRPRLGSQHGGSVGTPTSLDHPKPEPGQGHERHAGHGGHRLMMLICCVPMLLIAGLLVLTGAAGSGVIVYALVCTAMMAAMMFAMPGGHGGNGRM